MKQSKWILLLALSLAAVPSIATEDGDIEPPEDKSIVEFVNGYQGSSVDDATFRVAEYDVVEPTPMVGLWWSNSPYDATRFEFRLDRLNSDQMTGFASLDMGRKLQVDATLDSLLHRLDHDPLSNLQAVSGIKVVRSTDLEPGADYQIRRRLYRVDAKMVHPVISGLSFRVGFREQQREGVRQVLSTSHCTSCHTVGQGREVDHTTTDFSVGAHIAKKRFDLDYQVLGRLSKEDGAVPTANFERAYRPAGPPSGDPNVLVTPFNDRLWFQDGDFAVNAIPDVRRTEHRLKFRMDVRKSDALNVTVVQSSTRNEMTQLKYDFGGFRGRYLWRPKDKLKVNFYAHRDAIDNDEVFVDLLDLNGLAAAPVTTYPGFATPISFEDWRRALDDPTLAFNSFSRSSSKDRTEDRIGVDASWRRSRRTTMRLGYRYRLIDRDHVTLADGTGKTKSHRLKFGWNQRVNKQLRWIGSATVTQTDNPYVNVSGGLRAFAGFRDPMAGIVLGQASSPKSPDSLQYYQLHALRVANLGSAASDDITARTNLTWTPKETISLSGNVRYRTAENDELNMSDWERDKLGVGANLWVSAGPDFYVTLGVDHEQQETDAFVAIPLMDG